MKKKKFLKEKKFIKRNVRKSIKEKDNISYNGWVHELQGLIITCMTKKQREKFLLKYFSKEELNKVWGIDI